MVEVRTNVLNIIERPAVTLSIFRNEAWRYEKIFGTHRQRLIKTLFRGFPLGFAAFVATLGIEAAFGIDWHDPRGLHKHGHGHAEHGEEGGHH